MKANPFLLPLIAAGGILTLVGVLLTVVTVTGQAYGAAAVMATFGGLAVTIGAALLAGGLVLAGVDWRLRQR